LIELAKFLFTTLLLENKRGEIVFSRNRIHLYDHNWKFDFVHIFSFAVFANSFSAQGAGIIDFKPFFNAFGVELML